MDKKTESSLEFQRILNKIEPQTPYGNIFKKKMRAYTPREKEKLKRELDLIENYIPYMKDKEISREIENLFNHIKDLRSSIIRGRRGIVLTEVELFEIKNFLFILKALEDLIKSKGLPVFKETEIKSIKSLEKLLDPEDSNTRSFYIYDAYSQELKSIREKKKRLNTRIKKEKNLLKEKIEEDLNIKLKMDNSISISKDEKEKIEKLENYPYLTYESETYMNTRYKLKPSDEINKLEGETNILKQREEEEELKIRGYLSKEIGKKSKELFRNIFNIGKLDLILSKAKYALSIDGVKPNIIDEHRINIVEGRHPIVEEFLRKKGLKYTPISISLNKGVSCITGANMGGKTISLKLVGLLSTMVQYGLFVPAKSMDYGLNEFIKTSIGDSQSTESGLSTFGGEIKTVQEAIELSDKRGLILIDELARGTNPEEGYAISKAIVDYLKEKNTITLLTTHYENIATGEDIKHFQVIGLSNMDFEDLDKEINQGEIIETVNKYMDYRLRIVEKNTPVPKDAINIAKIMRLEWEIVDRAEELIDN